MSTPSRSSRGRAAAKGGPRATTAARGTGSRTARTTPEPGHDHEHGHGHDITVTIPVDRIAGAAVKVAGVPIVLAQRVLPAKGGLPLYLGLGALGVAGALEWPIAVGIGAGYAVLRRGGALDPARARQQAPAGA